MAELRALGPHTVTGVNKSTSKTIDACVNPTRGVPAPFVIACKQRTLANHDVCFDFWHVACCSAGVIAGRDHDVDLCIAGTRTGENLRCPIVLHANQRAEHVGGSYPSVANGDDCYRKAGERLAETKLGMIAGPMHAPFFR